MKRIKFFSKSKEPEEANGNIEQLFSEVTKTGKDIYVDIEERDEINILSEPDFLSEKDAKRLKKWLLNLDIMPPEE